MVEEQGIRWISRVSTPPTPGPALPHRVAVRTIEYTALDRSPPLFNPTYHPTQRHHRDRRATLDHRTRPFIQTCWNTSISLRVLADDGEARPRRTDAEIIAHIRLKGETLDGREIESNEFLFPVRVCNGCMITYPADMLVDRSGVLTCPPRDPSAEDVAGPADVPLCPGSLGSDDSFVDCQTCQGLAIDSCARQLCQPPQIP